MREETDRWVDDGADVVAADAVAADAVVAVAAAVGAAAAAAAGRGAEHAHAGRERPAVRQRAAGRHGARWDRALLVETEGGGMEVLESDKWSSP